MWIKRFARMLGFLLCSASCWSAAANVIQVNVKVDPFTIPTWNCGGGSFPSGATCWGTVGFVLPIKPVTVEVNDVLRVNVQLEGPWLLRWEDDGIGPVPILGDEFFSVTLSNSNEPVGYQGVSSEAFSFRGVQGELLSNDLSWTFTGAMGGIIVGNYLDPLGRYSNLTNSSFAFSGFTAEFEAQTIGTCPNNCMPITLDQLGFGLGTGFFSIVHIPEPGTLPLISLALAGLAAVQRRPMVRRR